MKLSAIFKSYLHDESGAPAIEYALLLGLIALTLIGSITAIGTTTSDNFQSYEDELSAARP